MDGWMGSILLSEDKEKPLNVIIPEIQLIKLFDGIKSPVSPKPAREEVMEVVISSNACSPCLSPSSVNPVKTTSTDEEYDRLMDAVKSTRFIKRSHQMPSSFQTQLPNAADDASCEKNKNCLEKKAINYSLYRKWEVEEYSWESDYQMGPETFLLQLRDPEFASRIRDYRRHTFESLSFGDRCLGKFMDRHVSFHERRRFSDLIHSDEELQQLASNLDSKMEAFKTGKFHGLRSIAKPALSPLPNQTDQKHAPIFKERLKDHVLPINESDVIFECSFLSNPTADVTWLHNDSLLTEDFRHTITLRDNNVAELTIKKAFASDSGVYKCVIENDLGKAATSARLIIADIPERPSRPDVQLASDTEVFIIWDPPSFTGGLEILYYKIEYRRADSLDSTAVIVKRMEPLGIYQFRVAAKTVVGFGEPSLSSRIIQTHHRGAPKLSVELLKREFNLNVVYLPTSGDLGDIPEELDYFSEKSSAPNESSVNGEDGVVQLNVIIPLDNEQQQKKALQEFETFRDLKHENVLRLMNAYKKIVYLNLLPDHIMFQSKNNWTIKLIDMGNACRLGENDVAVVANNLPWIYTAPEVILEKEAIPASDVWAVGLLSFILLSGMHPFAADSSISDDDIVQNVKSEKLDINWIFGTATQEAIRFTTAALKKHPKNRISTEEGLEHKWLSLHDHMRRRRENIRFSSNRLRLFEKQYYKWMTKTVVDSDIAP
ncbi:immunoglobulin I-set domain protein [Trichinella nativa]|uniref:Immunoglobulin I-set domain protein n=1 Tax=Trichinella nativa TaxID=6335 RepID=A0A1Y3ETD8_9BILA|nr:immunoglobulin I-set domain protein [Trichinella nativa]